MWVFHFALILCISMGNVICFSISKAESHSGFNLYVCKRKGKSSLKRYMMVENVGKKKMLKSCFWRQWSPDLLQCFPCLYLQKDHIANKHESSPITLISCSSPLKDYLENPSLCHPVLEYMLTS